MKYYGRSRADGDHEPAGDGNPPHSRERSGERRSAKPVPKRPNWAWAVATDHYDWMEAHSPASHYD